MKPLCFFMSLLLLSATVRGSDLYFVRFSADGYGGSGWNDEIVLHNTSSVPEMVRFVGVSNGPAPQNPPDLVIPPNQTILLNTTPASQAWLPANSRSVSMWMLHLDVPDDVVVESRDEFGLKNPLGGPSPTPPIPLLGKVSMPVFRHLFVAAARQFHLGTDLGGPGSRINVGVFNAGAETATASIEIRRMCDDELVDSRIITIAPNTVVQAGGLTTGSSENCPATVAETSARYTVVTVTQPSVSFVSNINDTLQPSPATLGVVPLVGLAISQPQP